MVQPAGGHLLCSRQRSADLLLQLLSVGGCSLLATSLGPGSGRGSLLGLALLLLLLLQLHLQLFGDPNPARPHNRAVAWRLAPPATLHRRPTCGGPSQSSSACLPGPASRESEQRFLWSRRPPGNRPRPTRCCRKHEHNQAETEKMKRRRLTPTCHPSSERLQRTAEPNEPSSSAAPSALCSSPDRNIRNRLG